MPSEVLLIAIFVSPLLIGCLYQRSASGFSAVAALLAAFVTATFLLSSLESRWADENKAAAIAPFDLNSDGVLGELELNEEARLALPASFRPHPLDFMVVEVSVGIWNLIGLMIWPVFSSSPASSNSLAEQPQIHGLCPACGHTLGYNTALIGLDGMCPNCKASIIFPAPENSDA